MDMRLRSLSIIASKALSIIVKLHNLRLIAVNERIRYGLVVKFAPDCSNAHGIIHGELYGFSNVVGLYMLMRLTVFE